MKCAALHCTALRIQGELAYAEKPWDCAAQHSHCMCDLGISLLKSHCGFWEMFLLILIHASTKGQSSNMRGHSGTSWLMVKIIKELPEENQHISALLLICVLAKENIVDI